MTTQEKVHAILLFDGVCNLCNSSVNFVIDRDPAGYFKLAALQSKEAEPIMTSHGIDPNDTESIVLVENGKVHRRSGAALRVCRHLNRAWPLLTVLLVVPPFIRDTVYDFVAARRYKWFGKQETCRVPTPELLHRFL